MAFRRRANSRRDKRQFTRTAMRSHPKNYIYPYAMRGGIRL